MRLLIFSTQYMPTGGIESHLRECCLQLVKSGVEIDFVVTNSRMLPENEVFFRQICRRVYLIKHDHSLLRFIRLLLVGVQLRFKRYNALYTNGQGESIHFFAKLVAHPVPWVHHHHTAGDESDRATWGKNYWKALQYANRIIACSQRNAVDMSLVLKRNVDVIPCFSRQITHTPTVPSVSGKVRFGYYGRLIPEKGINLLCQLSEDTDLQGAEFHLWGEGLTYPASFFEKFRNLWFHGPFHGRDELAAVLGFIDALLLLSTHPEGLPISLLEAMSAGLPWLATDKGGIPDIALDPNTTRVISASADYAQIKSAVMAFTADLKAGQVSSKAQEKLYSQKFSASVLVSQWKEALGLNHTVQLD